MVKDESGSEGTIVPLRMINLVKHERKLSGALPIKPDLQHIKRRNVVPTPSYTPTQMNDDGVACVDSDLQWLRYVQATTADHEFTKDWGKRMEEILIPVGSLKIEESSSGEQNHEEGKDKKRKPKVGKPKESNETLSQEQGEASPKPA